MTVTLHRWGNSMGLRLPKPLLEQIGLGEGSKVDIKIEGGRLVIEPVRRQTTHDGGIAGRDHAGQQARMS